MCRLCPSTPLLYYSNYNVRKGTKSVKSLVYSYPGIVLHYPIFKKKIAVSKFSGTFCHTLVKYEVSPS